MTTELWAIGLVILGTIIGSSGPILFKKGSEKFTMDPRKLLRNPMILLTNWQVILGCAVFVVAASIFIPALRGGELSVLFPVVSMQYVWVSLLSIHFLNEKMNLLKWLGIVIIIVSVMFIGMGSV